MHQWESLSHVRWECKYHVVIIPKYRQKVLYGQLRAKVGRILRELCQQRGVGLVEGKAMLYWLSLNVTRWVGDKGFGVEALVAA